MVFLAFLIYMRKKLIDLDSALDAGMITPSDYTVMGAGMDVEGYAPG